MQTPRAITNLPGLPAIGYRAGVWGTFKESMLARLSSSDYPALAPLKTRSDDDFTIAFLDATSIVLDILTFYQERLANESYLSTATQLRSLTELSRLIGYQPASGISADVYLSFTLKGTPGQAPDPSTRAIIISAGTRAQSIPAQGQIPQTFETSIDIPAKSDWNALPVQADQPWTPPGTTGMWLSGTATQLKIGDYLLILGAERENYKSGSSETAPSTLWALVLLTNVRVDPTRKSTYVSWETAITTTGWTTAKIFALRQRAALFGHNAPSPYLFVNLNVPSTEAVPSTTSLPLLIQTKDNVWAWNASQYAIQDSGRIQLDASYPKFIPDSWLVLQNGTLTGLFKIVSASRVSLSQFALSAKVTQLATDYEYPNIGLDFPLPSTDVLGQSEQLQIAPQPLTWPLYGIALDLEGLRPDLAGVAAIALSGCSQKIAVADAGASLTFVPDDATMPAMPLHLGDVLTVTDPSNLLLNADGSVPDWAGSTGQQTLFVHDAGGRPGSVTAALGQFTLLVASKTDPVVREFALVARVSTEPSPYPHTRILLQSNLQHCYDRSITTVNANVAPATHGQTVSEILGSGAAAVTNQNFTLRQSPVTYVHAATPLGSQSTLKIRANGVLWSGVPSLYQQNPTQRIFSTLVQDDGTTDVLFGDGVEGATLPTGQNNIQASYRVGSGTAGNVAAGAITTLIDRPLGVSGVINPSASNGGQDPQPISGIRTNAPQTVLTLGRTVSLEDYQNLAATFAGISRAYALWIPAGPARGVFLTVAGIEGAALPPGSATLTNLATSLRSYGNPLVPITVVSYVETLFSFTATLRYDPAYTQSIVQAQVLSVLSSTFSFAARTFGQHVRTDEIVAAIQGVAGVIAVNVTGLRRGLSSTGGDLAGLGGRAKVSGFNQWLAGQVTLVRTCPDTPSELSATLPSATSAASRSRAMPQPAEILVIDPVQITLEVLA